MRLGEVAIPQVKNRSSLPAEIFEDMANLFKSVRVAGLQQKVEGVSIAVSAFKTRNYNVALLWS